MISCQSFFDILKKYDFTFFTGIPDSTFKDWTKFLADKDGQKLQNIVPCNECEATAIATGYYLATKKIGVIYMQNSGFGKTINPLTSLCDPDVYSIPVLLLIGWRGEPGKVDEPQHKKMGKVLLPLLETLKVPYNVLEPDVNQIENDCKKALIYFKNNQGPYAFIIRSNFFENYPMKDKVQFNYELVRDEVINLILDNASESDIIVSSTGYISREVYEYREARKKDHNKSFYNVGSMGCACSIGLSIALQKSDRRIIVLDGDGAIIMQMGAFTTIGKYSPSNFVHIIFDNNAHESTGGQPTNSATVNFVKIALAANYKRGKEIKTKKDLIDAIPEIKSEKGPIIFVIKIKMGTKPNLKRPEKSPIELKQDFIKNLTNVK